MREIRKKTWPKWFKLIKAGKVKAEYRLADFGIKPGDVMVLEEWDPKTKRYTGRSLKKRVKRVFRKDPLDYYTYQDLKRYGLWVIEF